MSFSDLIETADRAVQENLGGTTITYQPHDGQPVEVVGMFDENYVLASGSANAGVEQITPSAWFRLADLPVHPEQDNPTLVIDGKTYMVRGRQIDKAGGSIRLLLHRTSG